MTISDSSDDQSLGSAAHVQDLEETPTLTGINTPNNVLTPGVSSIESSEIVVREVMARVESESNADGDYGHVVDDETDDHNRKRNIVPAPARPPSPNIFPSQANESNHYSCELLFLYTSF